MNSDDAWKRAGKYIRYLSILWRIEFGFLTPPQYRKIRLGYFGGESIKRIFTQSITSGLFSFQSMQLRASPVISDVSCL